MSLPKFSFPTAADEVASTLLARSRAEWCLEALAYVNFQVLITGTLLNGIGFETALAITKHANLTKSYVPRAVFVSSSTHIVGTGVNLNTIGSPEPVGYDAFKAYFQAKSVNLLTVIELSKRSKGEINAYSLHPGNIDTNITRNPDALPHMQAHVNPPSPEMPRLNGNGKPNLERHQWKTLEQGASTTVVAALDTRLNDKAGAYLIDCNKAMHDMASHTSDPTTAETLCSLTEEIVGEKFTF
ncbi:hypothetical protein DFH09DRAFT_1328690 [Mycena vulgaris]|nr:hypothetical protein DFH09DRAFT_1328690 [Mycena vulgaris]